MLRITTLVENSPGEHKGLVHEHGLCFHIDTGRDRLLFDTGQSDALVRNADRLRVGLDGLSYVALSHGHYDHTGGLRPLAACASGFKVVTGAGFFADKYGVNNGASQFLGNDFDADWLERNGIAHVTVDEPVRELVPGVYAVTDFPRTHPDETVNPRFKLRTEHGFVADTFADEMMLVADTPRGLVAVLGCAHPGVKNMLDAAATRLNKPIHAVIGGTHLVEASTDSLALTLQYFADQNIAVIGASHCTGGAAMGKIAAACGDKYFHNSTGTTLFVE
jgi:7,8-dihydropterin-6-yl-methyl-4-(beta-D-ribofuranosyl)aminobenzene 5'-phosphate synthase